MYRTAKSNSLSKLTFEESVQLLRVIVQDENILNGTDLCFQMFYNILGSAIRKNEMVGSFSQLNALSRWSKLLKKVNKFDSIAFSNSIRIEFLTIPLEVAWWLNNHGLFSLWEYCTFFEGMDLSRNILNLLQSNKTNETFPIEEIVPDLLTALIQGCYRPNVDIYALERSKDWSDYCLQVVNELVESAIQGAVEETDVQIVNFFPYVRKCAKSLPSIIMKLFYKNILNKLMVYQPEYGLYDSLIHQQLWCSTRINKNLLLIYEEVFMKYCSMESILELIGEYEEKINWKFSLAAVGVCVQVSATGAKDAKDAAMKFLNESFKGGKMIYFTKAILFIRQACLEEKMGFDYRTWYTNTFGSNGNFKTTKNATWFKFLISALMKLIPYEPCYYLTIHIQQSLSAPPKCAYLVHDYKNLCRAREKEFESTAKV